VIVALTFHKYCSQAKKLKISFDEHPFLVTECALNPKLKRERTTQVMFETFSQSSAVLLVFLFSFLPFASEWLTFSFRRACVLYCVWSSPLIVCFWKNNGYRNNSVYFVHLHLPPSFPPSLRICQCSLVSHPITTSNKLLRSVVGHRV